MESSGFVAAAPGGGGPETSMHLSADANGGTAGGTGGDAQGLAVSSMRVGSSSLADSGLNPSVSAVNRSSVAAANFGSTGTVGWALGRSSVPPAPTLSSKWWENVASANTLIPGADILTQERSWVGVLSKFPKLLFLTVTTCRIPHGRRTFC